MRSKKGFISFILFFILSLGILSLSTPVSQTESVAPAQIFKSTHETHIHLKRAFKPAANSAAQDAKLHLSLLNTAKSTTLTLGPQSIVLDKLTTDLEDDILRVFILQKFNTVLNDYSTYSDFNSNYYCALSSNTNSTLSITLTPLIPPNTLSLWSNCASKIQITHLKNQTKIEILDGFYIETKHKFLPVSMGSKLQPFEVS